MVSERAPLAPADRGGETLTVDLALHRGELSLAVALQLERGCLALTGPSGAGKTTILRLIAGLDRPDAGRIACGAEIWFERSTPPGRRIELAPERRRCGYVAQDYALFGHMRAWENVAFGLPRGAGARRRRRAEAHALLEQFGLRTRADARPRELSGGERQRVALARAMASRPRLLLLDEPLAALDPATRAAATAALHDALSSLGVPAIVVTHDFLEAALLADEIAVLDRGRIVQRGDAATLTATPASAFVAELSGANVLRGDAQRGDDGLTRVSLLDGGTVFSSDPGAGRVAVCVHPWEVTLAPPGHGDAGSARNIVEARVLTVTVLGNRARVALACPQPLSAEITAKAAEALALGPGDRVCASFKATATRLIAA